MPAFLLTTFLTQFTPVLALYDPDVPLNLDIAHSPTNNFATIQSSFG